MHFHCELFNTDRRHCEVTIPTVKDISQEIKKYIGMDNMLNAFPLNLPYTTPPAAFEYAALNLNFAFGCTLNIDVGGPENPQERIDIPMILAQGNIDGHKNTWAMYTYNIPDFEVTPFAMNGASVQDGGTLRHRTTGTRLVINGYGAPDIFHVDIRP